MAGVIWAVVVLAGLGVFLALLLVLAERKFTLSGPAQLKINENEPVEVAGGEALLSVLKSRDIFIPSACGGRGSCGLCKVRILKGGGPLLPTETPHLSEEEREGQVRLSCQVKVREDLEIQIPESFLEIEEYPVRVDAIRECTYDTKKVRLSFLGDVEFSFRAGQYVQVETPIYDGLAEPVYRAYSISSPPSEKRFVELIVRKVPRGICTTYVHELLLVGDQLKINGPYGDFYLRETEAEAVFIAGGSGLAPFEAILAEMAEREIEKKVTLFFGTVSRRDLYDQELLREFEGKAQGFRAVPALSNPAPDDDWDGERGLITEVVARHYGDMSNMEGYLCGSPGMIDACIKVLTDKGLPEDKIYFDKFT
ncbi:MAG: 2Fe-2S iron-sulfur cluster binding domain-containing protein [Deferrisomatales bacterium]|nr:2Fe-2S iron-sulfur cluster binding domain-containing protein [Deferrisomatales bacterium]